MITPLSLYNYKSKIVNIVDGDTFDAVIDTGFHGTRLERLRLASLDPKEIVDAYEIRGPEKQLGLLAKAYAEEHLLNKEFIIHTEKTDVFGRWLATIFMPEGGTFNEMLIASGHTKEK